MSDTTETKKDEKVIAPISPMHGRIGDEELISLLRSIDSRLSRVVPLFEKWDGIIDKVLTKYRRWWL